MPINVTTLATGRYEFTVTITEYYQDGTQTLTYLGYKDVLNRSGSAFGSGWNLDEFDALAPATSGGPAGVSFVESDGAMGFFWSNGSGGYTSRERPLRLRYADRQLEHRLHARRTPTGSRRRSIRPANS